MQAWPLASCCAVSAPGWNRTLHPSPARLYTFEAAPHPFRPGARGKRIPAGRIVAPRAGPKRGDRDGTPPPTDLSASGVEAPSFGALGAETAERLRKEFVYSEFGPYADRAASMGKPQKMDLTAPFVTCTYSTVESDAEQEAADQARMCLQYEMTLRKIRRQARMQVKREKEAMKEALTEELTSHDSGQLASPVSYFYAFVSRTPAPPPSAKVWDAWTLVAQLAVAKPARNPLGSGSSAAPSGPEEQAEDLDSKEEEHLESLAGYPEGLVSVHTEGVDKWELPGRMSGKAMNRVVECVAWRRPDLVFVKRPCFELRFEPQEALFDNLLPLLLPNQEGSSSITPSIELGLVPLTAKGGADGAEVQRGRRRWKIPRGLDVHASICRALALDSKSCADTIADGFATASSAAQAEVLRIIFSAATWHDSSRRDEAAGLGSAAVTSPEVSEARSEGTSRAQRGASVSPGSRSQWASKKDDTQGMPDSSTDKEVESGGGADAKQTKRQRIKLYGKHGQKGALGDGVLTVAVCPYDYSRLVYEVCHMHELAHSVSP